ncbi:hypothetical protein BDV98DRAFT_513005 [Pterulicium gracile]|uniref:DUF1275 domain protein n=1 Tax=Pterulicium gracile TaxID=1884261 RepID=A0A5C3Q7L6_9AGAR|nr:hypothetical protein BDV98DRAFT_513005 [Pterula gracilis]
MREQLWVEVDPHQSSGPLAAYCLMTGYIDVISFSAIFVWCGFQTGNFCQLALAIARLFGTPQDLRFHIPDQQALCSLITFNMGAFLGRIGDRMGVKTRIWLFFGTMIQAVLLAVGAIVLWQSGEGSIASDRGEPAWRNTLSFVGLGFISASLGLQGIMGKRLNTQFTTTVVLTTVWCELMCEPELFKLRHLVKSRDLKVAAAMSLFLGGFAGRAILDRIGAAGALGVGVGFRVLIAISWLFVPPVSASKSK